MMRKKLASILLVLALAFSLAPAALAEGEAAGFSDVTPEDYYYQAVRWAVRYGVTNGTGGNAFSPDEVCTRGQVVTFLWRVLGRPEPSAGKNPFLDVRSGAYYEKPVLWAVEHGVTQGTAADRFSPDEPCTCAQILTFLWRADGSRASERKSALADAYEPAYYAAPVRWAEENNMLSVSGERFDPDKPCTRGLTVAYLFYTPAAPHGDDDVETCYAKTAQELFEAVGPNRRIVLTGAQYDVGQWAESVWGKDRGTAWNKAHPYVRVQECFDGVEVVLTGVDDLHICGASGEYSGTQLITQPRYADVLGFEKCRGVRLAGLTMGHTPEGTCTGSVLRFADCGAVSLEKMDLYGCGIKGIEAEDIRGLSVNRSRIRQCSDNAVTLDRASGRIYFGHTEFVETGYGLSFWNYKQADIGFYDCKFGASETNSVYYMDSVSKYACTWEEVISYPDYGEDWEPDADFREGLSVVPFDAGVLKDSSWQGVLLEDTEVCDHMFLPFQTEEGTLKAELRLRADGTTYLTLPDGDLPVSKWSMGEGSAYLAVLTDAKGKEAATLSLYADRSLKDAPLWMCLNVGGASIWMSRMD